MILQPVRDLEVTTELFDTLYSIYSHYVARSIVETLQFLDLLELEQILGLVPTSLGSVAGRVREHIIEALQSTACLDVDDAGAELLRAQLRSVLHLADYLQTVDGPRSAARLDRGGGGRPLAIEDAVKLHAAVETLRADLGRKPTLEQVAEQLNVDKSTVQRSLRRFGLDWSSL